MASFACGTRDELRARRPGGRLFIDGRPYKLMISFPDVFRVGQAFRMGGVLESVSRNQGLEWDAVSQRGRKGKLHPIPDVNSGTRFPDAKKAT